MLAGQQASLTGQLASAVAAQQTAQAKVAAAAVVSAAKVVTTQSSARSSTGSSTRSSPPVTIPTSPAPSPPPAAGPTGPVNGDPYPSLADPALNPFLACVVQAESGGDYGAVSPNGTYMGAFQFSQPTWNSAASAAGLGLLVGVPPNLATKPEQDSVAVALFALDGQQPWLGDRCS